MLGLGWEWERILGCGDGVALRLKRWVASVSCRVISGLGFVVKTPGKIFLTISVGSEEGGCRGHDPISTPGTSQVC